MTCLLVGQVEVEARLADIANIPVRGLDFSIKFFAIPFFETWVGHLLCRYIAGNTAEYRQKYY